ncbi:L-serine ammonia-lyase [Microbulbifer flavimaris]|uniref:L-serine dehydratase n=1 Tax=Microbulbifer flavimaris TaxID=1781068 RepID=A0ABX4I2D0_9GAMM|nr:MULTISPECIES: L-serine ammonia-lyase [Microbulbifer]KUJ84495.1 serine ammonia-lyase [Microbulbifer sp. ZGT114]PCO06582.1 L-serine ammonia-lyase [Microbulbifer flavimaris]
MSLSVFDLFKIGIGPSSSHTVGPMKAASEFLKLLDAAGRFNDVARVTAHMFGSLGATGVGHGTTKAVMLGLEGENPETVDTTTVDERVAAIKQQSTLALGGRRRIAFDEEQDLLLIGEEELPLHANGMRFSAHDTNGRLIIEEVYYSIGGGFVVTEKEAGAENALEQTRSVRYEFQTAEELLDICDREGMNISDVMLANEAAWRSEPETRAGLMKIWQVMQGCVANGIENEGTLPGGLSVKRRAADLYRQLRGRPEACLSDPLAALDWVTLYALAVNEENAAGGRIVTAPTNGAAGIIPAVLHYFMRFSKRPTDDDVICFLLTAAAVGILFKKNASISGAEVGCQGEVGSACSMAAAGLAEVLGGTPRQVENAAEIAMEHNLGLTCDPVGGLVQVPCIERNAMASVKAISAARMALRGDGEHLVSLDKVIRTMRDTGRDMQDKYKETARGGLAVNVIDLPVSVIEC